MAKHAWKILIFLEIAHKRGFFYIREHGFTTQPISAKANLCDVFNFVKTKHKRNMTNCVVEVEHKCVSPIFGFVLKTSNTLGKSDFPKIGRMATGGGALSWATCFKFCDAFIRF